jgi:serine/threonine protein kinase
VRALVLELVEGPTLAERLAHGPLPLDEALLIARQIAEALEAAHDKGIVHRDLKPANVKAPPDAPVKVLDLGLALALPGSERESIDSSNSPTLTVAATQMGLILGTAGYMSPEQASGKRVDKRADIWSFGVVFWEMLTGRALFDGETVSHTLADVLRAPIDFANVPATTPGPIREVLRRCLDRDVKTRLRDIGEARVAIQKWIANPVAISGDASPQSRPGAVQWFAWAVAGVMALAMAALAIVHLRETPLETPVARTSELPPDEASGFALNPNVGGTAISPDGRLLAFAASVKGTAMLWVRPLDSLSEERLSSIASFSETFAPSRIARGPVARRNSARPVFLFDRR